MPFQTPTRRAGPASQQPRRESENDPDWFVFYIKTYSQIDFSAATVDSKCQLLEDELWIDIHDRDGKEINSLGLSIFDENEGEVNHRLVTMNPGRYYLSANARGACEGTRYRFRIDPAGSLTTSRECGEGIVAKESVAPLINSVNQDLTEKVGELAAKTAEIHAGKKELRQAGKDAEPLRKKIDKLVRRKRAIPRKRTRRLRHIRANLRRQRAELRKVRDDIESATEQLDVVKSERRPIWKEKLNLDALLAQHQQTAATADAQIAKYCA